MFIVSFKTSRKKILVCACALLALVTIIVVLCSVIKRPATATMASGSYSLKAGNDEERIAFLKQFGWEVTAKPIEVTEVTIPQTFNSVYENYNKIQKEQGLDLSRYEGKTCKQWVYEIKNYPSQTASVRATLLVLDDQVIGGDICSAALNGFICGFSGQKDTTDPDLEGSASDETASETASKAIAWVSLPKSFSWTLRPLLRKTTTTLAPQVSSNLALPLLYLPL